MTREPYRDTLETASGWDLGLRGYEGDEGEPKLQLRIEWDGHPQVLVHLTAAEVKALQNKLRTWKLLHGVAGK